jgi:hypothetical protein
MAVYDRRPRLVQWGAAAGSYDGDGAMMEEGL